MSRAAGGAVPPGFEQSQALISDLQQQNTELTAEIEQQRQEARRHIREGTAHSRRQATMSLRRMRASQRQIDKNQRLIARNQELIAMGARSAAAAAGRRPQVHSNIVPLERASPVTVLPPSSPRSIVPAPSAAAALRRIHKGHPGGVSALMAAQEEVLQPPPRRSPGKTTAPMVSSQPIAYGSPTHTPTGVRLTGRSKIFGVIPEGISGTLRKIVTGNKKGSIRSYLFSGGTRKNRRKHRRRRRTKRRRQRIKRRRRKTRHRRRKTRHRRRHRRRTNKNRKRR